MENKEMTEELKALLETIISIIENSETKEAALENIKGLADFVEE